MKIYVAASWREIETAGVVVAALRAEDHEVFDFTEEGQSQRWHAAFNRPLVGRYSALHARPWVREIFARDAAAVEWCDGCVLVSPAGHSAGLEAGVCIGMKKPVWLYATGIHTRPELMHGWIGTDRMFEADELAQLLAAVNTYDRAAKRAAGPVRLSALAVKGASHGEQ